MSKIFIGLEAQALVPTLQVYKEYFDAKYPCTDESNDGSNMPLDDEIKFLTYNHLLDTYNKSKTIYNDAYQNAKKKVSEFVDVL